jgi:hypothetical protein
MTDAGIDDIKKTDFILIMVMDDNIMKNVIKYVTKE